MDLGLRGKRAAVAAGSAGLGLGCAKALAAEEVLVSLCGRDRAKAEAAAADIGAVALMADVSDVDQATGFIEQASDQLGGTIDIVVANAGGPPAGTFASTDLDGYRQALELNLLSSIALCRAAVPRR